MHSTAVTTLSIRQNDQFVAGNCAFACELKRLKTGNLEMCSSPPRRRTDFWLLAIYPFTLSYFIARPSLFVLIHFAMAPSSFAKHRFQNSLDLAAARSMRNVGRNGQSGTGNAWCIVDSPTLGRMSSVSRRTEEKPQPVASGSRLVNVLYAVQCRMRHIV